jgi:hypothetical protein
MYYHPNGGLRMESEMHWKSEAPSIYTDYRCKDTHDLIQYTHNNDEPVSERDDRHN